MNPHSPTDSWLKSVCDDSGSMYVERPSGTYEVSVEKVND